MAEVTLSLKDSDNATVPAVIVGDLAVHRHASMHDGQVAFSDYWSVTHVPTGLAINSAIPDKVRSTRRDTLAWVRKLVEACADQWEVIARASAFGAFPQGQEVTDALSGVLRWAQSNQA